MRTLLIGGGIISDGLLKVLSGSDVGRIRIRELVAEDKSTMNVLIERCEAADLIVYAAYHHTNLLINIRVLRKVLRHLRKSRWKGLFVFLNTQAVLPGAMLSMLSPASPMWRCDLYSLTKRIQSRMLERQEDVLNVSEIYLPVVIGDGTRWQDRLRHIAEHRRIAMPNVGQNAFAYLDMQAFLRWLISTLAVPKHAGTTSQFRRRLFVYEGVDTFYGVLARLRRQFTADALVIDDLRYRHSYSPSTKENLVWWLKLSVLGCVLFGLRGLKKTHESTGGTESTAGDQRELIDAEFRPVGPEYRFFGMSIDMNRIGIPVEKIG